MGRNQDKLIQLSNAGNIDIDVNCYFCLDDNNSSNTNGENGDLNMLKVLKFKNAELRIEESLINLPAHAKQKRYARMVLLKLAKELSAAAGNGSKFLDQDKTYHFFLQVKPDGFQYVIPLRISGKVSPKPQYQMPAIKSEQDKQNQQSSGKSEFDDTLRRLDLQKLSQSILF